MSALRDHFHAFARYNLWANRRLCAAAAQMSDADYRKDAGAFFGSMRGTLNHILVADRIWMKRFTGQGDAPARLDAILFDAFADLRAEREAEDARIVAYVAALDDVALNGVFRFARASSPELYEQQLGPTLSHVFNHQTHHRGQAHAILTALGYEAPELDLLFFQREAGIGGARRV